MENEKLCAELGKELTTLHCLLDHLKKNIRIYLEPDKLEMLVPPFPAVPVAPVIVSKALETTRGILKGLGEECESLYAPLRRAEELRKKLEKPRSAA
jgi:hypothetical protein